MTGVRAGGGCAAAAAERRPRVRAVSGACMQVAGRLEGVGLAVASGRVGRQERERVGLAVG